MAPRHHPLLPSAPISAATALVAVVMLAMVSTSLSQQQNATITVANQAEESGIEYVVCINPDSPQGHLKLDYELPVGDMVAINVDASPQAQNTLCGVIAETRQDRVLVLYDSRNEQDRRRCLPSGCTLVVRPEGLYWQASNGLVLVRGFEALNIPLSPAPSTTAGFLEYFGL